MISHLHVDHLHFPSLALIDPGTPVLIPRGAGRLLRKTALEAVEVSAGDEVKVAGATIRVVPAVHDDTRWPFGRCAAKLSASSSRGKARRTSPETPRCSRRCETLRDASTWPCSLSVDGAPGCVAST